MGKLLLQSDLRNARKRLCQRGPALGRGKWKKTQTSSHKFILSGGHNYEKKVLAVLLGGCMVVGMLAGCGSKGNDTKTTDDGNKTEGSGDSKGYHFEVVVKSFQSSYWQAAVQGINQACDELGVTANTTGPNAESDIADQVNMLNNAINKDPDGIALAACDQNSVIDSLKTALEKKIPVVCFDSGVPDAPEGSVYATVVTDNEQAGGIAAEHIYPAIKDKLGKGQVRVGEVNQDATSANISERGMGFINKFIELAKADGFTVAVVGNDFYVTRLKTTEIRHLQTLSLKLQFRLRQQLSCVLQRLLTS